MGAGGRGGGGEVSGLTVGDMGRPNLAKTSSLREGQNASMICHEAVQKSSSSPSFLSPVPSPAAAGSALFVSSTFSVFSCTGAGFGGGGGAEASAWNNPEAIITSSTYLH